MDPDYFENIIAREKYRKMVLIPTFIIIMMVVLLVFSDVMHNNMFIIPLIFIVAVIAYFICRYAWIKFVVKYGSSDDQIQRILSHHDQGIKISKFDIMGLMDTVMSKNLQKSEKIDYPQPENLPTQITLKRNEMEYEAYIIICVIILVSVLFYFFYYLIYKFVLSIVSLGLALILSGIIYYFFKKIKNNQNILVVNQKGLHSHLHGLVPWDQILNIRQFKVRNYSDQEPRYDVFLEYWTELSIMKIDISGFSADEYNTIDYLISKYKK